MEKETIFLKLANEAFVPLYPVTCINPHTGKRTCYPFVPSQGQNLKKVLLWFDSPKWAPGCAYMAHSRVSKLEDQVIPVARDNMGQI